MNGFRNSSRNGQVWRYQRAGGRAVILEVSGGVRLENGKYPTLSLFFVQTAVH